MIGRKIVTTAVLASALLAGPAPGGVGHLGVGAEPALARLPDCKFKIEVCSEVDLVIWRGEVCVEYCIG